MAKKKSVENKNFLNKYVIIIAPVITFILGWLAHIGYTTYDSHINRPILSFKIKTLTINETLNGASSLRIILNQENKGESV